METYNNIIKEIQNIILREEPILSSLANDVITSRFNQQNRSIKMLIGHLIDSASNNHQRMVRLQYAPVTYQTSYLTSASIAATQHNEGELVFPDYTQHNDLWLYLQDYQHEDWNVLIQLFKYTNLHICHIIRSVNQTKINNYWIDYEGNKVSLDAMIHGYLSHLNLHIAQIHELIKA